MITDEIYNNLIKMSENGVTINDSEISTTNPIHEFDGKINQVLKSIKKLDFQLNSMHNYRSKAIGSLVFYKHLNESPIINLKFYDVSERKGKLFSKYFNDKNESNQTLLNGFEFYEQEYLTVEANKYYEVKRLTELICLRMNTNIEYFTAIIKALIFNLGNNDYDTEFSKKLAEELRNISNYPFKKDQDFNINISESYDAVL